MKQRSQFIEWLRGEVVGPAVPNSEPAIATFIGKTFHDEKPMRSGFLGWQAPDVPTIQEVLYFGREAPNRKYGAGCLHPEVDSSQIENEEDSISETDISLDDNSENEDDKSGADDIDGEENSSAEEDFEIRNSENRKISTLGVSFATRLLSNSVVRISIPTNKRFAWQDNDRAFPVNGRYERCERILSTENGHAVVCWRRVPALSPDTYIEITRNELVSKKLLRRIVPMPKDSPIVLSVELLPRKLTADGENWLITIVIKNATTHNKHINIVEETLFQTFFEVSITNGGYISPYPESPRPFDSLDVEEQNLHLLYSETPSYAIGHNCAAGWDSAIGSVPDLIYADVLPAVELPSMTPDIVDPAGNPLTISMRELSELDEKGSSQGWKGLIALTEQYEKWIEIQQGKIPLLDKRYHEIANRNLDICRISLDRIKSGLELLRKTPSALLAFKLANLAMLLQQISTKQLQQRPLEMNQDTKSIAPSALKNDAFWIYENCAERKTVGNWRAFQIAFILMSIKGLTDEESLDHEIVDLIWFPTGGGKTEAYLGAAAYLMFLDRTNNARGSDASGTKIIMRYTLRMLTTQQFQRSASLICAMEYIRRNQLNELGEAAFSLGLWIGGSSTPIRNAAARTALRKYRAETNEGGNPFVLTECPWCRAGIGKYQGSLPNIKDKADRIRLKEQVVQGISDTAGGPRLHCTDVNCEFGQRSQEAWLPIEVIDERIYHIAPTMIIGTADKFAMIAYRPEAGALFGFANGNRVRKPPKLIIQDELHLISGPLGTLYGLYEGIIEKLCSYSLGGREIKPKIIASTATIRGAKAQVSTLYGREHLQLFPSPALRMADSFFGRYATNDDGSFQHGRLYLGFNLTDFGSVLTTQVRTFAAALYFPMRLSNAERDPWWTLLAFYNSIRELGGAQTLFNSDIPARLEFINSRERDAALSRRYLNNVKELTGRLSQSEIVQIMDELGVVYVEDSKRNIDASLASNIIEVGVDIDRLSLMAIVGQPKTTSQYIQVSGRVGRRWHERPGLVLMIYNPSKNRDISHFEQFHGYHRRLYERVEPTSATPFALPAIESGLAGALLLWARLNSNNSVSDFKGYSNLIEEAFVFIHDKLNNSLLETKDKERALSDLLRSKKVLLKKWSKNPMVWEEFPPIQEKEYLMLWPGQYYSDLQKKKGVVVPTSLRQVDASGKLQITGAYLEDE